MMYAKGLPDEEQLHAKHHNAHTAVFKFPVRWSLLSALGLGRCLGGVLFEGARACAQLHLLTY